jgi:hypothetical protein
VKGLRVRHADIVDRRLLAVAWLAPATDLISTSSWLAFAIKPDRGLQGEVVTHPTLRSWLEPD